MTVGFAGVFLALFLVSVWGLLAFIMRRTFPQSGNMVRCAAALVLLWSVVVACSFGLSLLGLMAGFWLWVAVPLVLLCVALILQWRLDDESDVVDSRNELANADHGWTTWIRPIDGVWALVISYVFVFGLFQLPVDWDTIAYHLPIVDHWIQSGDLCVQDSAFWYVPGNNELLAYCLCCGFDGDFLAQLHNLLPATLLVVVLITLCRELQLDHRLMWLVVLSVVFTQPVLRQIISAENDIDGGTNSWYWLGKIKRNSD